MTRVRVVITPTGCISPLGLDVSTTQHAIKAGQSSRTRPDGSVRSRTVNGYRYLERRFAFDDFSGPFQPPGTGWRPQSCSSTIH
jgi:hypothetical protein